MLCALDIASKPPFFLSTHDGPWQELIDASAAHSSTISIHRIPLLLFVVKRNGMGVCIIDSCYSVLINLEKY